MKRVLLLLLLGPIAIATYSQGATSGGTEIYTYAYISIQGRAFSKKLTVQVDIGDTQEQIILANKYSEDLNNKKSYASILNYMAERFYELVETRDLSYSYQGTGGSSGIVLIMKKPITRQ